METRLCTLYDLLVVQSGDLILIADERRPTVNELSNQKGVLTKASGWKMYHLATQLEEMVSNFFAVRNIRKNFGFVFAPKIRKENLWHTQHKMEGSRLPRALRFHSSLLLRRFLQIDNEKDVLRRLTATQEAISPKHDTKHDSVDGDVSMIHELTQVRRARAASCVRARA